MSKLQSLTHFLKTNLPERVCQVEFTSEMDEIQFIPAQKDLGLDQYQMMIQQCDVLIAWGRFPYREIDPRYIPLLINAWFSEQDNEIGDSNISQDSPTMSISINGDSAEVIVSLLLSEPVIIKEDPQGIIPFDDRRWSLTDSEMWHAEYAEIYRELENS